MKKRVEIIGRRFTLVEILLVISVMFIMLAMTIPSQTRSREYALQVYCMNNERQIALGYHNYVNDWNGQMPLVTNWLDDFTPIYVYVRSLGVFKCPVSKTAPLKSLSQLNGGTDYLCGGKMTDVERNLNYNNGHGNSAYNFDISNNSPKVQALIAKKNNARLIYDNYYKRHFKKPCFNVVSVEDLHYYTETKGVLAYWILDERGNLETSDESYPDLPEK